MCSPAARVICGRWGWNGDCYDSFVGTPTVTRRLLGRRTAVRVALVLVCFTLPATLLVSSLFAFRELDEIRAVFLRNLAATVAARLETLPADLPPGGEASPLWDEFPSLVDLRVFERPEGGKELAPLWEGRQLFRFAEAGTTGQPLFRAFVPFHSAGELAIARIDLDPAAAETLVSHARHNAVLSLASGFLVLLLAAFGLLAERRMSRLERERLQMEHLAHLGTMSAVLAHEIRNPLGTIKGFVQLAREKADSSSSVLLDPAIEEVGRIERLVQDLLRYGRLPAPVPREISAAGFLAGLREHSERLAAGRPARFSFDADDIVFRTDPELLEQAVLNLVRNSVEALPEQSKGEIAVSVRNNGRSGVSIRVEDNGPGLPADAAGKLFEPFYTTKPFGTGLGLPTCRKIVEALGGTLAIEPRDGGGTAAEIRFGPAFRKDQ